MVIHTVLHRGPQTSAEVLLEENKLFVFMSHKCLPLRQTEINTKHLGQRDIKDDITTNCTTVT